ncbi:MAG TPA: hypothetical protein PKD90_19665 [Phnomibacter sp.]|nr:hypothetical protein [Phnomibacter sp.]
MACKKDQTLTYDESKLSDLKIKFDHVAGNRSLQLNIATYNNAMGEAFTVSQLMYYVSNIKLTNKNGKVFTLPQDDSYFLVKEHEPASKTLNLKVPEGEYTKLEFIIGVDSLRSTMDISKRTGVLDPAALTGNDKMYWNWNTGYIFWKMEGSSPQAPADPSGNRFYRFHIGLYGGYSTRTLNNLRTITLDLSAAGTAQVITGKKPSIHLIHDVLKAVNGTTNVSFATHPTVMVADFSQHIANNYAQAFMHDHTHANE